MLILESHTDVTTKADGKEGSMRIFVFHPSIPGYPKARFPGVVLFSEIYQGEFRRSNFVCFTSVDVLYLRRRRGASSGFQEVQRKEFVLCKCFKVLAYIALLYCKGLFFLLTELC